MRILVASLLFAVACGGPQQKKESSIVEEGSATPDTCCCKTIPETAEKEILPVYAMGGRMECSTKHGDCVPDVQCNGSAPPPNTTPAPTDTGVPPPPDLPAAGN
jgi:hypothetical protein